MNRFRLLAMVVLALVVAVVGACEGLTFDKAGTINVHNLSATKTVLLSIVGDDVNSYPTLGPDLKARAITAVGGSYTVTVTMSDTDLQNYRNNLQVLKHNVQKIVDGTASNDEKVLFFTYLAQINSAIAQAGPTGVSCHGKLTLNENKEASVSVTVDWLDTLGGGSWQLACGSN